MRARHLRHSMLFVLLPIAVALLCVLMSPLPAYAAELTVGELAENPLENALPPEEGIGQPPPEAPADQNLNGLPDAAAGPLDESALEEPLSTVKERLVEEPLGTVEEPLLEDPSCERKDASASADSAEPVLAKGDSAELSDAPTSAAKRAALDEEEDEEDAGEDTDDADQPTGDFSVATLIDNPEEADAGEEFTYKVIFTGPDVSDELVTGYELKPVEGSLPDAGVLPDATPLPDEPVEGSPFHATDDMLEGTAYAVFDSEAATLTFFRSHDDIANASTGSFADIRGTQHAGVVFSGFEQVLYLSYLQVPWGSNYAVRTAIRAITMAEGQAVRPLSTAHWFENCTELATVDLSRLDSSRVTSTDYMFGSCVQLESLDLSSWDTSNVFSFRETFHNCSSLTELDLSNFDTRGASNMSGMFHLCPNLSQVTLGPNFSFSGGGILVKTTLPTPKTDRRSWVRSDGAYGPYTPMALASSYNSKMAGRWVWEEEKSVPDIVPVIMRNGELEFALQGGQQAVFSNIPAGTGYLVYQETPKGWELLAHGGTQGFISARQLSSAWFLNRYLAEQDADSTPDDSDDTAPSTPSTPSDASSTEPNESANESATRVVADQATSVSRPAAANPEAGSRVLARAAASSGIESVGPQRANPSSNSFPTPVPVYAPLATVIEGDTSQRSNLGTRAALNVGCFIATVATSAVLLFNVFGRVASDDELLVGQEPSGQMLRLVSLAPALASLVLFMLDHTGSGVVADALTAPMAGLLAVQLGIAAAARKAKSAD